MRELDINAMLKDGEPRVIEYSNGVKKVTHMREWAHIHLQTD